MASEHPSTCTGCQTGTRFDIAFTMAFQPIVALHAQKVWGYEALVRGPDGESAASILAQVTPETLYTFDQACRVRAIELAGRLFNDRETRLSINFLPNAVYEPKACIRTSLAAARRVGFGTDQLMFELTENELVRDTRHLSNIVSEYRRMGFITALDDFGSGYAGLGLLADLQPDILKIDMHLVRDVDSGTSRQAIIASIVALAETLGIQVIAEGVETKAERDTLSTLGVRLFQGYLFAKPAIGALPPVFNTAP